MAVVKPASKGVPMQKLVATSLASLMFAGSLVNPMVAEAQSGTSTPIKHLVVIFQENISFDHYFGTYPKAFNPAGQPRFTAKPETPAVNGYTDGLLFNNPNALNTVNADGATNPFRLDRSQASTADQDHDYLAEQQAFHAGLMDSFPKYTGTPGPPPNGQMTNALVMGYYDGNTVTAYWNYAQQFAMSDNSYDTNFGPSTPGAINLISGQTVNADGSTGCNRTTTSAVTLTKKADYIPHHQPFQYYTSTANPKHTRPSSVKSIGFEGDAANHQYDINDFYAAVKAGNFPSVSFLKAPGFQDGPAG